MIETITVEGFRSIAKLRDLAIGPLNILIGANGAGKSNLLEALEVMRMAVLRLGSAHKYAQRAGGADRILHFGSKVTKAVTFDVRFANSDELYTVQLLPDAADRLLARWTAPRSEFFLGRLRRWGSFHFHDTGFTSPIKKTADVHDNRHLRQDGANLAPFLFLLREGYPDSYDLIRRTVRLAAPFFDDFALQPLELNKDKIRLEWRHVGSDAYFDASSLSDGSLRFIALSTVLLQPPSLRPSVILLDEPELGLHPYATTLVASMLKQASTDSQIIAATQSPTLLDHFEPEDVLVAEREAGATEIRRLSSSELTTWLEDYSLGQLWEKNEIGGRPSREHAR